jgi:hypothetical protein
MHESHITAATSVEKVEEWASATREWRRPTITPVVTAFHEELGNVQFRTRGGTRGQ